MAKPKLKPNMNNTEVKEFLAMAFDGKDTDLMNLNNTMIPNGLLGKIATICCKRLLITANAHWTPRHLLGYLKIAQVNLSKQVEELFDYSSFSKKISDDNWPLNNKFGRCLELGYRGYNATTDIYCSEEGNTLKSDFTDSFCPAQIENVTTPSALITGMASDTFVLGLAVGSAAMAGGYLICKKWNDSHNYAAALQSDENLEKGKMLDTL